MNMDAYLAYQRARTKTVSTRAEARLRELGGEPRRSVRNLEDMTAEEIERDTASIRHIMSVWKRIGLRNPGTILLPSGRKLVPKQSATERMTQREYAIGRPLRHKGKGRR